MKAPNKIILDFSIWGFESFTHEYISETLNIEPVKMFIKGAKMNPNLLPVAKENGWRMTACLDETETFESQMNTLLDIIEGKLAKFKEICNGHYCEFSCAVYLYHSDFESTPWIHLDSRYHRIAKELNAEFDFDIYYG